MFTSHFIVAIEPDISVRTFLFVALCRQILLPDPIFSAFVPKVNTEFAATADEELSLEALLDGNYLMPGDLLDPIDPDWEVDAVITDDRTIRINGPREPELVEQS